MRRIVKVSSKVKEREGQAPVCLLEVKYANDVFTITLVLLNGVVLEDKQRFVDESLREALKQSLGQNIKFKLAVEKWGSRDHTLDARLSKFVQRAASELLFKELSVSKLLNCAQGADVAMASQGE